MKIRQTLLLLASCIVALSLHAQTTIVHNIKGYSLNADRELVEFAALQFTGGEIDRLFASYEPPEQQNDIIHIDGGGNTLIPGLIDAHGHVLSYGMALQRVSLTGLESEQDAVAAVRDFSATNGGDSWILGRGWNQVLWSSGEFPTASSLDALFPDRPVWLTRVDGHAGWANSAAIELAGVDILTPDPDGGQIIKDSEGRPAGVFVDNAMSLITRHIPPTDDELRRQALITAMQALAAQGLTSVHDAGVSVDVANLYRDIQEKNEMPMRISVMLAAGDPAVADELAKGRFVSGDQRLQIASVKISADGALGSRGAAMLEDYSDQAGHRGLLLHSQESLYRLIEMSMRAGFQVGTHAIGDAANKMVLDNYETLIEITDSRDRRHRVEHAQILRYEDLSRFSELGVIASMQATHATSDKNMAEDRIGPARIQGAYAWRKLLDSNTLIANGSDFPVESPNPFFGLHAAITRQDQQNQPPGGWYPEESMTAEEAFASFTLDAAYAAHQEDVIGSLEAGKLADFIIIDHDLFADEPSGIWQTNVLQTWVHGERVF